MRTALVVAILVVLPCIAQAEVFGLAPTLLGDEKPALVEQRGASGPLPTPSLIVGLESYGLWGPDPGVAGVFTAKRQLGTCKRADAVFYGGVLAGISTPNSGSDVILGGVLQAEIGDIGGIVVIVRRSGGATLINPGINVTALGWKF